MSYPYNERVEFTFEQLWGVAQDYLGWDYSLQAEPHPKHKAWCQLPGPTFPLPLLQTLIDFKDKTANDRACPWPADTTRWAGLIPVGSPPQSNCCMFTSSVLFAAAVRVSQDAGDAAPRWHIHADWQVAANKAWEKEQIAKPFPWYDIVETQTLPRDYVVRPEIGLWIRANFASALPSREAEPVPGQWYICAVEGHSFFIIDYDPVKKTCLTLEAAPFGGAERSVLGQLKIGYVGHRGRLGTYRDSASLPLPSDNKGWPLGKTVPADWKSAIGLPTWAGYLSDKSFICAKLNMREVARFRLPLDAKGASANMWKHYANNEIAATGVGGYYAIGLRRNIHGGIHLYPPTPSSAGSPVHVMAPGHVVAARLPGKHSPMLTRERLSRINAWPGFVLVRHEAVKLKPDKTADGAPGAFFSLYMHLMSPNYLETSGPPGPPHLDVTDAYFKNVDWFKSLTQRRFGAFVRVSEAVHEDKPLGVKFKAGKDAASLKAGDVVWATEKVKVDGDGRPEARAYKVLNPAIESITPIDRNTVCWLYKPSPANLEKAFESLAKGEVVTFNEAFLPVAAGEVVGLVSPLPPDKQPDPPVQFGRYAMPSGFIHWQVFAPVPQSGKSGIQIIEELAKKLQLTAEQAKPDALAKVDPINLVEVIDQGENNFIDEQDIKGMLGSALPDKEEKAFEDAFVGLGDTHPGRYAGKVIELFNENTNFSQRPTEVDWETGCSPAYPLTLQIERQYLMPPGDNTLAGGKYTLTFEFLQKEGNTTTPFKCSNAAVHGGTCRPKPLVIDSALYDKAKRRGNDKLLNLILMVPAEADVLRVGVSAGIAAEAGPPVRASDIMLLKDALEGRWRGSRVRHPIEWSKDSFGKVKQRVKDVLDITIEDEVDELAWVDPGKEVPIARVKHEGASGGFTEAGSEQEVKVFGSGGLVPAGKIDNLHPISAVWLLNALDRRQLLDVADGYRGGRGEKRSFGQDDGIPLTCGWVTHSPEVSLGDRVIALAVDDDFDELPALGLEAKNGSSTLYLAEARPNSGGVLRADVDVCFWGDWSLQTTPKAVKKAKLFGPEKLSIKAPELDAFSKDEVDDGFDQVRKLASGGYAFLLKLKSKVPQLAGCISFDVAPVKANQGPAAPSLPLTPGSLLLPVTARGATTTIEPIDTSHLTQSPDKRFITGLATDTKGDPAVSVGFKYSEYKKPYTQFRVAGVLLQTLAAGFLDGGKATVTGLSEDGRTLRVRPVPARKDTYQKLGQALTSAAAPGVAVETPADTALFNKDKKPIAEIVLKASGDLAPVDQCEDLKGRIGTLEVDDHDRFVLDVRAQHPDLPPTAEFRTAFLASMKGIKLSVALARALATLRKQYNKGLTLTFLSLDGFACRLRENTPALVELARSLGLFMLVDSGPEGTRLVANPDPERMLACEFQPAQALREMAKQQGLGPGDGLRWKCTLEVLNGLHYLRKPSPGHSDFTGSTDSSAALTGVKKMLTRSEFQDMKANAAGSFSSPAFPERTYRVLSLGAVEVAWKTVNTIPVLEVTAQLQGAPSDWAGFKVKVSHQREGDAKWTVLKGWDGKKVEELKPASTVTALLPVAKEFVGKVSMKVEALPPAGSEHDPQEKIGQYDCKPRWLQSELDVVVDEAAKQLIIRGQTDGVERAERVGDRYAGNWAVLPEFTLSVTEQAPPVLPAGTRAPKEPKKTWKYTVTSANNNGGLDENGWVEAKISFAVLRPGATYTFTIGRLGKGKVRNQPLDPRSGEGTCPAEETHP